MSFLSRYGFYLRALGVILSVVFYAYQAMVIRAKNSEIKMLNGQILVFKNEAALCNLYLEKQNLAIKAMELKPVELSTKETERIKKVYLKDKSCESELKSYKELFGGER